MPFKRDKVGLSDDGYGIGIEQGLTLPWPKDPKTSWVYYDCTVEAFLDSGIVVHNRLPQVDNTPDTLASCVLDDAGMPVIDGPGVNLRSVDQYADIVQRMAHSRYWFNLWGRALRIGRKVPIPSLKTIAGVPAIPHDANPQRAFCRPAPTGYSGGAVLWHAEWSLWYTTAVPPTGGILPTADPVVGRVDLNPRTQQAIQAPYSQPDDVAVQGAGFTQPGQFGFGSPGSAGKR